MIPIDRAALPLIALLAGVIIGICACVGMAIYTLLGRSDRFRRAIRRVRGLCPECAYDLTGNESGVCPECGTATAAPGRDPES